jgi:hypothetical protein
MTNLFVLLFLVSFVLLIIGLFSPDTSLFWYKKARTRKISSSIYAGILILSLFLVGITAENKKANANDSVATATEPEPREPELSQIQKDSIANVEKEKEQEEIRKNTISANSLVDNYIQNEVRADENFKSKKFYVVGYVGNIGKDIMDDIYITLSSDDIIRSVQCYIEDKESVLQLQKGQKVTIYGTCNGLMMNVQMKDCQIVENLPKK